MKKTAIINYVMYACIILVIVLAIIARFLQPKPQPQTTSNNGPIPTTGKVLVTGVISHEAGQSESYQKSVEVINKKDEELINHESAVGQLYEYLPYRGITMRVESDKKLDRYILTIKRGKEAEGNTEFDTFLKSHDVQSRTWIRPELLVVQYE